eukprot:CAMPEP_0194032532 /NCGR_PEP_ID=MMETSP0009_2-20130614/5457_1 /TAXON_ID=210454 /ORGANISM="Grammatophora oceanica, Strain CCMP 410" /LENGTH=80 /DNA_ID=CAMNT_0038673005 /DNA_START=43 /DNA_END=282 /DNA_ORIENTATION=+
MTRPTRKVEWEKEWKKEESKKEGKPSPKKRRRTRSGGEDMLATSAASGISSLGTPSTMESANPVTQASNISRETPSSPCQ